MVPNFPAALALKTLTLCINQGNGPVTVAGHIHPHESTVHMFANSQSVYRSIETAQIDRYDQREFLDIDLSQATGLAGRHLQALSLMMNSWRIGMLTISGVFLVWVNGKR
jgi:hypothetical protein